MMYPFIFINCLDVVLHIEGGYSNHPSDSGGATYKGITQGAYDAYRLKKGLPLQSVRLMSDDEMKDIYFTEYWSPMNLSGIKSEAAVLELFDMGVNAGTRTAIKLAQKLVGAFADGIIGYETTELINTFPASFTELYKANRKMYYIALARRKPELKVFLKGWLARVDKCRI